MWDTIVVVLVMAVAAWYLLRRYFGPKYSGSCGCGPDCAGCGSAQKNAGRSCSGPGSRAAGLEDFRTRKAG